MTRTTYRGVTLKVTPRGAGTFEEYVGGVSLGKWIGGTEARRIEQLKRTIDAAGERPDGYQGYWHPKDLAA
jgi:hypothetical protein